MKTTNLRRADSFAATTAPNCFGRMHRLPRILAAATVLIGASSLTEAQFVPGAGGSIPAIQPFTALPNQIGGLKVEQSDRENIFFGNGTRAILDLRFTPPSSHGATGYRMQRSIDGLTAWEDQPWNGGVMETSSASQDNFSFNPDGNWHYRLLVLGGPKNGYTSNVVWAPISSVDTRFAGWGLDQGMFITGIMSPWVGSGMTASFHVRNLSDDSVVEGGLTYQWYRVNPMTYEMTPIQDATGLTYATTEADVGGYELLCRATGNGTTVGGFIQIGSSMAVKIPNKSFVSNVSETGFRLNLYKSVPSLAPADLELSYWSGVETVYLPITSVTAQPGNASFDVAVAIPQGAGDLSLVNKSNVWGLGEEMSFMPGMPPHFIPQVRITLPGAGFDGWIAAHPGIPADRREPLHRNGPMDLQNLAAYAMGLDPISAAPADLPRVDAPDLPAGTLHFIFRRAKNLGDVTLKPRISSNLTTWADANVVSQTVVEDGGDWERVDALIQFTPGTVVFLVLAVESTP